MTERSDIDKETTLLARGAAEQIFSAKDSSNLSVYEPRCFESARAAVCRFGELFEQLPGSVTNALEAASNSGELISSDRLQGLAEILQNADDAGASEVRLLLRDDDLLVNHNGDKMQLRHVLGVAMPWFSTKRAESETFGRFGIGLSALRSISNKIDVHCSPYHFRLGQPVLSPINPQALPAGFDDESWTVFRVILTENEVSFDELTRWIKQWGDAGLLFLRNVAKVDLYKLGGGSFLRLSVQRDVVKTLQPISLTEHMVVYKQCVKATDERSWMVYNAEVPTPIDVSRTHKKMGKTTAIGVALPLFQANVGQIYAGLPVVTTPLPVYLNAQFDPLTNRRDLADTPWNRALIPLIVDVWSYAAIDLFRLKPVVAWLAMPIELGINFEVMSALVKRLCTAIIQIARDSVATQVLVDIHGKGLFGLTQLAIEAKTLEGVVTEEEAAKLLNMPATLPTYMRDGNSRWRMVLDDWREAGAELPEPLSVERALELLRSVNRPVLSTIALVAAGLRDGLGDQLAKLPCLVTSDGKSLVPPSIDSPETVVLAVSPLARELGIATALHAAYVDETKDVREVIDWLRERGALLDGTDDQEVLHRLASAGKSYRRIEEPLTDEQVDALRRAFELLDSTQQDDLGRNVGRAIVLSAFEYELQGKRKCRREVFVSPTEAYLPRSIDRGRKDNFAAAADKSPGIVWLNERYAKTLKSSAGRSGLGAQRFLVLLGAETAPRPREHRGLIQRYGDLPQGLPADYEYSPESRTNEMSNRGATYTLRDWECQDLIEVVKDIARVRQANKRRTRARALLTTMGRAWERLSEFTEVESANDHYGWVQKGSMPAFWLWQVRNVTWLDDERGNPRRPSELRIRTPGTEAVYGEDSLDFVHKSLDGLRPAQRSLRTTMAEFGVSGNPTRLELIERLRYLRDEAKSGEVQEDYVVHHTAIIYKALAESCKDLTAQMDLSKSDLRREFRDGNGLIFTNFGWRPPETVLDGPSVFGQYKAFAPPVSNTKPLWKALQLKAPSLSDCIQVLQRIARKGDKLSIDDEAVQIQTLRLLVDLFHASTNPQDRHKLAKLRLWTSQGWKNNRPIFATDDESLVDGLKELLPLWKPGGELDQFRSLLNPLRVREIFPSSVEVVEPELAHDDEDATRLFHETVQQLKEDLVRNEPHLVQSLDIGWDALNEFQVQQFPTLKLRVHVPNSGNGEILNCNAHVRIDPDQRIIFVREPQSDLPRADRGGRALATLFNCNRRRVAQAWRAAWDLAESGRTASSLELAQQKDERIEADIDSKLGAIRAVIESNGYSAGNVGSQAPHSPNEGPTSDQVETENKRTGKPRVLVDPRSLNLVDRNGQVVGGSTEKNPQQPRPDWDRPNEPHEHSGSPQNQVQLKDYSDLDRENIGLELLRMVINSNHESIIDLRTQCGVGADAMDKSGNYYELKVSAGNEPKSITLTNAELQRARSSENFFLVIVSRVEGTDARPTVRIIPRPLDQLEQSVRGTMILSGLHEAKSKLFEFAPSNRTGDGE